MTNLPSDRKSDQKSPATSPWAGTRTEVAEFIDRLAPTLSTTITSTAPHGARGRLIFAMDATASRMPTWDLACRIQGEMFEATAGIGGLDLQLIYYGGYDTCRASRWVGTATDLHRLMRSVQCVGGETQIERVLARAIHETGQRQVNALVFVGDAMEEKEDRLCRLAGDLGALKVPLFIFHEGDNRVAESCFKQMAVLSRGQYLSFDLSNVSRLKDLLGAVAIYSTGDAQALADYGRLKGGETQRLTAQLKLAGPRS